MINISKEEIGDKMFFIREENSNQVIAVIKVGDLMKFERPQGEWIEDGYRNLPRVCSYCGEEGNRTNFCPYCGSKMEGVINNA